MIGRAGFNDILDCIGYVTGNGEQSRIGGPNACEVKPHSKPWIVRFEGGCGGTLIAKNAVLSAKHCGTVKKGNIVYLGDHSIQNFDIGLFE